MTLVHVTVERNLRNVVLEREFMIKNIQNLTEDVFYTLLLNNAHPPSVVWTPLTDYDLTTTQGIDLLRFALFCKKCSFREEKYDAQESR